ncbi:M57 family metalloprotease [Lapidilactobacillus wuchangensis]|uniref:M57 family metalloprotease n=1 Tax=Lapidilactobacillus wuchangensis TaxID=2486001 RepID=UPI000F7A9DBE|nr:M57 family metalloprotease [Lapidilactobacillus wuchangensis]
MMKRKSWLTWVIVLAAIFFVVKKEPQLVPNTVATVKQTTVKLQPYFYLVRASINNRLKTPLTKETAQAASTDTTPTESPLKNLTTSNTYQYYFESDVPANVRQVFEQAVTVYNQTGLVKLVPGQGKTNKNKVTFFVYDKKLTDPASETVELGNGGPTTLAWNSYAVNSGRAGLNLAYPYIAIKESVAIHELGHALGLAHNHDQSSVMYPLDQGLTTLSTADINGLRAIYAK